MPLPRGKVAFVTGANGITGNALVEHLVRQPESEWSKIVITSRRRVTQVYWQDPRIRFLAIDFLKPVKELVEIMKPLCHDVTHAFFASYIHDADFTKLKEVNVPLFTNFLTAIDTAAPATLQRVCLHTGGKHYGAHLGPTPVPLSETMPRYEDYGENFYYDQEDFMFDLASRRNWTWNIIRPDAIIGFTPSGNGMSMALTLAIYFLCCRETGEVPIFPGNKLFFHTADDCSYAPSIADLSVWASTHKHASNEAFNHANGDVFVWKYFWLQLGRYFNVEIPEQTEWAALGDNNQLSNNFSMRTWAADKRPVWNRVVAKYGGSPDAFDWGTWDFVDWGLGKAWSTLSSVRKARRFGWTRSDDSFEAYIETFRAFENAGILPLLGSATESGLGASGTETNGRAVNPRDAAMNRLKKTETLQGVNSNATAHHEDDLTTQSSETNGSAKHCNWNGDQNGIV